MTFELNIIFIFLIGIVFGSFLNVCILRIPQKKSINGRSKCPQCSYQLSWYDNIPILSYLFLKGKCRKCHLRISPLYPIVELLTGLLALATFIKEDYQMIPFLIWFLGFICPLIIIIFIDFKHQIIPDVISLPGILIGSIISFYCFWPNYSQALSHSILGILTGGGSLFLLGYLYYLIRKKEGMGGGDVKFAGYLGAIFGYKGVILIFFLSSILAIIYHLITSLLIRSHDEEVIIPYGPFLAGASFILYFFGNTISNFYFELTGLPFKNIFPF